MKQRKSLLIFLSFLLVLTFAGCGDAAEENEGNTATVPFEKHTIAYPQGYDTMSSGASSYAGMNDYFESPYFVHSDFYNSASTDNLTMISNFETYQQTTEYTCGACAALMVLNQYDVADYDELTIAKMSQTSDETGVGPAGLVRFFDSIGWETQSNLDSESEYTFDSLEKFTAWVNENLASSTPIMVDWLDWSGHWQVIIGYDTMGTADNFGDDVIIFADSYDTSDQYQDGYYIFPAERFYYMWREGIYTGEGPLQQPWVIAAPSK